MIYLATYLGGVAVWGRRLRTTVLTFAILASTTSSDDGQLALVAAGLFAAFPVAWVLEWRIGRHERAAHAAASSTSTA